MQEQTVTLINVLSVEPSHQQKLLSILKKGEQEIMAKQKGYLSSKIYKSKDGRSVTVLAQWESPKDIEAVKTDPKNLDYLKSIQEIAEPKANLYEPWEA